MNKGFAKATAFTLLIALMLSLSPAVALAAPETRAVSVPAGESSFTIELTANGGSASYAGIEFGLTVSNENALSFTSYETGTAVSGSLKSPFVTKDGVHYFGFFADENVFSGRVAAGALKFDGYTGNEPVTLTLSYMNVNRLMDGNNPIGQENSEPVLVITVSRASSGGPGAPGGSSNSSGSGSGSGAASVTAVVDIPDPGAPAAGIERELYLDVTNPAIWHYEAVYYVTDARLMNGVGGNYFFPGTHLTRAMFVTILGRMAEQRGETATGFSNPFIDVPAGQWYTQYVAWAADKGIVMGYDATTFAPDVAVTREQMAALMIRFCDYKVIQLGSETGITFSDAGDISAWAKEAVGRTAAAGLMQGANGQFRPQATSTRAEVAQLFTNFLKTYME